jgi:quinol monooxygenase YgiN
MVTEVVQIEVKPGFDAQFEKGVQQARPVFLGAQGCHEMRLWRSLEQPLRYRLVVEWETLEDHTIRFRGSPAFTTWRELVQDCFASPPQVEHQQDVQL